MQNANVIRRTTKRCSLVEFQLDELLQLERLARDRVLVELLDVRHDVKDLRGGGECARVRGAGRSELF